MHRHYEYCHRGVFMLSECGWLQGISCHMDGRSARNLEKSVWSRGVGVVVYVDWIHLWKILIPYCKAVLSDLYMLSYYIFFCTVSYRQEKFYIVGSSFDGFDVILLICKIIWKHLSSNSVIFSFWKLRIFFIADVIVPVSLISVSHL